MKVRPKYTVVVQEGDGWVIGSVKEVPGALVQARNIKELFENLGDAITMMEEDE